MFLTIISVVECDVLWRCLIYDDNVEIFDKKCLQAKLRNQEITNDENKIKAE